MTLITRHVDLSNCDDSELDSASVKKEWMIEVKKEWMIEPAEDWGLGA